MSSYQSSLLCVMPFHPPPPRLLPPDVRTKAKNAHKALTMHVSFEKGNCNGLLQEADRVFGWLAPFYCQSSFPAFVKGPLCATMRTKKTAKGGGGRGKGLAQRGKANSVLHHLAMCPLLPLPERCWNSCGFVMLLHIILRLALLAGMLKKTFSIRKKKMAASNVGLIISLSAAGWLVRWEVLSGWQISLLKSNRVCGF